jgi:two-component system nitrate/nitrite response regulator NarL
VIKVEPVPARRYYTERDCEVLRHVARGLPNKTIAYELNITVDTVRSLLHHCFSRNGFRNRTQAAIAYLQDKPDDEAA